MSWGALAGIGAAIGANILASKEQQRANERAANKNRDAQEEFARMGVRWKVEDAKAAGIHPLYALGANTMSFSPSYVGDTSQSEMIRDTGQNINRAIQATASGEERQANQLRLEGMKLDNELKAAEIAKTKAQIGPALPMPGNDNFIPGQGNSALVIDKPIERNVSAPGRPAQEAGWRPDVSFSRTDTGLAPMIPQGLSESLEDDMIGKAMWRWRNQIVNNFSDSGTPPPKHMLPKGADRWTWSMKSQEWQPAKRPKWDYLGGR